MQDDERKMRGEERELFDRLVERIREIDSDFEAGRITPERYQEACDVIETAVDKMGREAIRKMITDLEGKKPKER